MFKTFLIVFAFICRCSASDWYDEAKRISTQNRLYNEMLYKKHNVTPEDYEFTFLRESFEITEQNRKADILIEFQRLLKNSNQCSHTTFKDCLRASKNYVAVVDRCQLPSETCTCKERYSRIGGYCNNLKNPNIGRARVPYHRMLEAAYEDGISEIRKAADGQEFPNPREIGNYFDKTEDFKTCGYTLASIHLMFSQMLTHDSTRRFRTQVKGNRSSGIKCCEGLYSGPLPANETNPACVPITLPKNDAFYADKGIFCQGFIRMQTTLSPKCRIKYEPENLVSSFVDLGPIYSDTSAELSNMRLHSGGLFKLDSLNQLPFNADGSSTSGDFEFSQNSGLMTVFVMFYRIVLGEKTVREYRLNCHGKCDKYDPKIDPTTTIDFAIAFRWFHTNIPTTLWLVNGSGDIIRELAFSDTYLTAGSFDLLKSNYTNLVRGLMKQPQRMNRIGYTDEYRNLFFKQNYRGHVVGADGLILDIMRARDGGIPPYIDYYPMCLNKKIKTWSDLEPYLKKSHFKLLQHLYKNVSDIEFMVGILMEKRIDGGNQMGKIGGCVTAKQYYNFKYGDQFFYSHRNSPYPFSKDQLHEIKKMTFSRLVCMTTDVGIVPKHGFISESLKNSYVNCSTLKPFNMGQFIHHL